MEFQYANMPCCSTKQTSGGGKGKIFNSSSSSSFVGSNIDILTLVLTRLPAKSLLVFKSVSKQWSSIITDPKFVHKHFIQNPSFSVPGLLWGEDMKPTHYYISLDGSTNSFISFESLITTSSEESLGIKIVQSCNGLLLCRRKPRSSCDFSYCVFNPFTNKHKILPGFQPFGVSSDQFRFVNNVSLVFDPFKSPYYKVIAIWGNDNTSCYEHGIEIYDSETSSWRFSTFYTCTPHAESIPRMISGVFCNGSLYWCHYKGSMVYFDIDQELVQVVPSPVQEYDYLTMTFKIAECRGHLHLFEMDRLLGSRFNKYEMDATNSSWNVKGRVDVRLNPYGRLSLSGSRFLLIQDIILYIEEKVVLITKDSMIVSYDPKDMRFHKIHDLTPRQIFDASLKFHQYIESLACV